MIFGSQLFECTDYFLSRKQSQVSLIMLYISIILPQTGSGELKTKPTQMSVRELRGLGLAPDLVSSIFEFFCNLLTFVKWDPKFRNYKSSLYSSIKWILCFPEFYFTLLLSAGNVQREDFHWWYSETEDLNVLYGWSKAGNFPWSCFVSIYLLVPLSLMLCQFERG